MYDHLSPLYFSFIASLSFVSIPTSVIGGLAHPSWKVAMDKEMSALKNNGTWDLVSLPTGKSVVGSWWVYTIKVHPDGTVID